MKKTMRFLSMAALALVGAVMTSCSSDDNIIDNPQQPENKGKTETLTTTVGFDEGATTRALDIDFDSKHAVKTFAEGETMAIIYKNKSGNTVKTVSTALAAGDITNSGKSATFTFTLDDPDKTLGVTYIYPAAMAKATIPTDAAIDEAYTVDFTKLDAQDGTLATLSSNLDLATFTNAWDGTSLPAGTLVNQLAVCALTLKNSDGTSTLTSGLTGVTVSDGSNTYTVTPTGSNFGTDVIYVAIRPVTAALQYTATGVSYNYTKTATSRKYEAGNFYNLGLRMTPVAIGHALSASLLGDVVGADGLAYAVADKDILPVTAAGMVAYKSGSSGLVIALADEASDMNWNTATGASGAAAHTPAVTGQTWEVPSRAEWKLMFSANGSNEASYASLNTAISSAGGTALQGGGYYWSSSENVPGSAAYLVELSGGNASWISASENNDYRVRACIAFGVVAATGHPLSESVVGEVVGTDGLAYAAIDKENLPTGVNAAGMVAYKNGDNGLVIALADKASEMNWETANGETGAAAHTPTVTGQTWKLPSKAEWNQMFSANGGNENSYTGLNTAITSAGGTALQGGGYYWSSTVDDSGNAAYNVELLNGNTTWSTSSKSNVEIRVRACIWF